MDISKEQILDLIQDYQQDKISEEGIMKLQVWLDQDAGNIDEFAKYLAVFKENEAIGNLQEVKVEEAWQNISKSLSKPQKQVQTRRLHLWLPYAAAVAVIFVVSYFMLDQVKTDYDFNKKYNFAEISSVGSKKAVLTLDDGQKMNLEENLDHVIAEADGTLIQKGLSNALVYTKGKSQKTKSIYNQLDVPKGGEYSLTLADGTKVWLNSESSLRYPVQFYGKNRRVELTGEAYFEVAHNKSKPFLIKARDTEVKVLGTKFNVSTYDEEEYIATTLVEGSVQVSCLGKSELLKPGDQAIVKRGTNQFKILKVNTDLYTSWTQGVFRFKDQTLEEISLQLSRWYNVEFFFTDQKYKNLRFTGAVKKNKSLDFGLEMIEKMANVKFAIKDDKVIVGR